jgi:hypothetical protein
MAQFLLRPQPVVSHVTRATTHCGLNLSICQIEVQVGVRATTGQLAGVLGLFVLEIDISAPEQLSAHAVSYLPIGDHTVRAYTLERIAGEKLRAFSARCPPTARK